MVANAIAATSRVLLVFRFIVFLFLIFRAKLRVPDLSISILPHVVDIYTHKSGIWYSILALWLPGLVFVAKKIAANNLFAEVFAAIFVCYRFARAEYFIRPG